VSYSDDELLPISALQHLVFCERQCALIHVERLWAENQLTVEGNLLHKKAHEVSHETIRGVRVVRSLWLVSRSLGLVGQADIVEFHPNGTVVPVEYKRGKPKKDASDRIQLCAQSLCLEEQLGVSIETADLFYGQKKRRTAVAIDTALREETFAKIKRLRQMIQFAETPPVVRMPKCDKCSLIELCLPDGNRFRTGAASWNERQYAAVLNSDGPETDDSPSVCVASMTVVFGRVLHGTRGLKQAGRINAVHQRRSRPSRDAWIGKEKVSRLNAEWLTTDAQRVVDFGFS